MVGAPLPSDQKLCSSLYILVITKGTMDDLPVISLLWSILFWASCFAYFSWGFLEVSTAGQHHSVFLCFHLEIIFCIIFSTLWKVWYLTTRPTILSCFGVFRFDTKQLKWFDQVRKEWVLRLVLNSKWMYYQIKVHPLNLALEANTWDLVCLIWERLTLTLTLQFGFRYLRCAH